jgi:hypothetical protein
MMLSEHFSLREMTKSQTAARFNIPNNPDGDALDDLKNFCEDVLEPVRANFGTPFTPSSGYRSPELNRRIGGSNNSQHCLGQAADIEVPGVANYELAVWIRDNLKFDQLILEHYNPASPSSGWVHVSYRHRNNRGNVMSFNGRDYRAGLLVPAD